MLNLICTIRIMGIGKLFKSSGTPVASAPATTAGQPPSQRQIYHSRFNHGPNFGGMFVAEKWISDELFGEKAKGTSELDAVSSYVKQHGKDEAKSKYEEHWKNWVKDDDWKWMRDHGVTAVRVPIGYWMVDGGKFTKHTPFDKYAKVYENAWTIFEDVIKKAGSFGIAVLVDLHGLPGGANGQDHSGTTSGKAELWDSSRNESLALDTLRFIAEDVKPFDNVCGIQVLNEAPWDSSEGKVSKTHSAFYLKALEKIREVNPDVPVVISDGWDLGNWVEWVKKKESKLGSKEDPQTMGIIIDTHVYKCFSDADKQKAPGQLLGDVDNAVVQTDDADIQVGEFSCVLDGQSWDKHQGPPREQVVYDYGQKQMWHFYYRASAGAYFWTYKFEHGRGGEWDFREMTDKGGLANFRPEHGKNSDILKRDLDGHLQRELGAHSNYWKGVDSNKDWEDWRYQEGFMQGWNDAAAFDSFDHSELGRLHAWTKSRLNEHIKAKGYSDNVWVYEHGLRKGVQSYSASIRS